MSTLRFVFSKVLRVNTAESEVMEAILTEPFIRGDNKS